MSGPALLSALGVVCLLACTAKVEPEPRGIPTVEVDVPNAELPKFQPPGPKLVPFEPEPAPAPASEAPVEDWALVKLSEGGIGLPWVRAKHDFGGRLALPPSPVSEPMAMGVPVVITDAGVFFAGRQVANIAYGVILDRETSVGHLIPALKEPLSRAIEAGVAADVGASDGRPWKLVALFADGATPFSILVEVLYTSLQAGARGFEIAVHRPGKPMKEGSDAMFMAVPALIKGQTETSDMASLNRQMVMTVSPTEVRIGRHVPIDPGQNAWLERISLEGDRKVALRRITALAQAIVAEQKWVLLNQPPTVLFSAEDYVPLELLIAVLAAATGPDCSAEALRDRDRKRCLFSARVVHADAASLPELPG